MLGEEGYIGNLPLSRGVLDNYHFAGAYIITFVF